MRPEGLRASGAHMLRHLANPQLLATYAIGFGVLFNFIAVFTYVSFLLAAPPYWFSSTLLGAVFVTYLGGAAVAPMTGWAAARFGRRRFIIAILTVWGAGTLLLLARPIAGIMAGLTLCAVCGMLCQTLSTGYPLVGGRPLRDVLLYRRKRRCIPSWPCLERSRMDCLRGNGDCDAHCHGGDRRHGVSRDNFIGG